MPFFGLYQISSKLRGLFGHLGNTKVTEFLVRPADLPATHAVMKHATVPHMRALKATLAKSLFLEGAIGPIPPSCTPIDDKFANPHSA